MWRFTRSGKSYNFVIIRSQKQKIAFFRAFPIVWGLYISDNTHSKSSLAVILRCQSTFYHQRLKRYRFWAILGFLGSKMVFKYSWSYLIVFASLHNILLSILEVGISMGCKNNCIFVIEVKCCLVVSIFQGLPTVFIVDSNEVLSSLFLMCACRKENATLTKQSVKCFRTRNEGIFR